MVKNYLAYILLCTLSPTSNVFASEKVLNQKYTVIINSVKDTIVYGRSLTATFKIPVKYKQDIPELFKELEKYIELEVLTSDKINQVIHYKIRIHARSQHEISIPELKTGNLQIQSFNIPVLPASALDSKPIQIKANKIQLTPWVREQTQILVTIITSDKNIILNNRNIEKSGLQSYLIQNKVSSINLNGEHFYQHTIGWNVFFIFNQTTDIKLPKVEYIKDGVIKYKFHLKQLKFDVKALPVYVSPLIPIGKLSLEASYLDPPWFFYQPDKTYLLQYRLKGQGIPAKWLPSLSQHYNFTSNKEIVFTPTDTRQNAVQTDNNLNGYKITEIAFTPLSNGLLPIKDINLQYFDPGSGLLKNVKFEHERVVILNWFLQLTLFFLLTIIVAVCIRFILALIKDKIIRHKNMSIALKKIEYAKTIQELNDALRYFSKAEGWPLNTSVNKWFMLANEKYIFPNSFDALRKLLNQALYSPDNFQKEKLLETKEKFIVSIQQKKRKRKNLFSLTCFYRMV